MSCFITLFIYVNIQYILGMLKCKRNVYIHIDTELFYESCAYQQSLLNSPNRAVFFSFIFFLHI